MVFEGAMNLGNWNGVTFLSNSMATTVLTWSGTRDWPKLASAQGIREHSLPRCSRTQNTRTAAPCACMNYSGPGAQLMENVLPFFWAWIPTGQPHLLPGLLMLSWGKIGWLKVASPTAQGFNTANSLITVSVTICARSSINKVWILHW